MSYSSFVDDRSRKVRDPSTNNKVLSAQDAFTYIRMVKEAFEGQPDKYEEFLTIMDEFKKQRIGIPEVTSSVKQLFCNNPELLVGFNLFLPKGYKIQQGLEELVACFLKDVNLDAN